MNNHPVSPDRSEIKFFGVLSIVLALFFASTALFGVAGESGEVVAQEEVGSIFNDIELKAHAAYVYDSRTDNVLFVKNENHPMPLASLTKVMSALVASELAPSGTSVVVSAEALNELGDSGLMMNERWSLKDLLDFSLTTSSNDGMKAVALALGALSKSDATPEEATNDFVRKMNETAQALNMFNTNYSNVTGLDESTVKGGAYGTARDMAVLFDYVLRNKPELLEATRDRTVTVTSLDNRVHTGRNTGYIVTELPGVKASKTGYTNMAGGNLAVAFDPEMGRPIIIVVLGSTAEGRFSDVTQLMEASVKYLQQ